MLLKIIAASPLRKIGTPEDIASLVSFLASDGANFITGMSRGFRDTNSS
jgi:NAD(P)-dependent dehydrogenase (short-subunit alcohol dehydrogenase family)